MFVALAISLALQAQTGNYLKDFFEKLSEAPPRSDSAMQDDISKVTTRISTAPEDLLAGALPSASSMLKKGDTRQKATVVMVLFEVARRQDGVVLLRPYLPEILECLRDPTPGIATFATYILVNLFPQPIDPVVPYLIKYVNDEQLDEAYRAGGIGTLVWYAPNDPAAILAITGFLNAKHGKKARAGAIHNIGLMLSDSHRHSPELVDLIVTMVKRDPETRLESIQALGRCGWTARAVVNPVLTEIAADEHESGKIREAAKTAIDEILHGPNN